MGHNLVTEVLCNYFDCIGMSNIGVGVEQSVHVSVLSDQIIDCVHILGSMAFQRSGLGDQALQLIVKDEVAGAAPSVIVLAEGQLPQVNQVVGRCDGVQRDVPSGRILHHGVEHSILVGIDLDFNADGAQISLNHGSHRLSLRDVLAQEVQRQIACLVTGIS